MPNELHTMPLKVEKLLSSRNVRMLKLDEFGAYMWLLCEAWLEGGRLPADHEELKRTLNCSEEQWKRVEKFVISKFFHPSEDGKFLVNETQIAVFAEVVSDIETKKARGFKGADARWHKLGDTEVLPNQCSSNAQVLLKYDLSNGNQSQSQNQNQREKEKEKKEIADKPPLSKFNPPKLDELKEYAKTVFPELDCESFISFYSSKGWMIGKNKMKDWKSAVITWKKRHQSEVKKDSDPYGIRDIKPFEPPTEENVNVKRN